MFDRILIACVNGSTIDYAELKTLLNYIIVCLAAIEQAEEKS